MELILQQISNWTLAHTKRTPAGQAVPVLSKEAILRKYKRAVALALNDLFLADKAIITGEVVGNALSSGFIAQHIFTKLDIINDQWARDTFGPLLGTIAGVNGIATAESISRAIDSAMAFDTTTPAMTAFIEKESFKFLKKFNSQQIANLRSALTNSLANNYNASTARELMRGSITLSEREGTWLTNYYNRIYDEAIKNGSKPARATRLAIKKTGIRQRFYLNNRIKRIQVTEISRAKHFGEINSFNQGIDKGKFKSARKTWHKTNDTDNWPSSITNDGQTVDINKNFRSEDPYPNEINEKCVLSYKIFK